MKLLIVRHAVAMEREDFKGASDELRPLTDVGVRKMKKNAAGLSRIVENPTLLVTSPLVRAVQTFEILKGHWKDSTTVISEALRPDAEPIELVKWLASYKKSIRNTDLVAVVGHEPNLSSLTAWIVGAPSPSAFVLKKGGAALFEFATTDLALGSGRMLWSLKPSLLRKLS